jgi:hypothetical protein
MSFDDDRDMCSKSISPSRIIGEEIATQSHRKFDTGAVRSSDVDHPDTLVNARHPAYSTCRAEVNVEVQGKKRGFWGSKRITLATQKFPIEIG